LLPEIEGVVGRPHAKSWDILEARFRANPDYELVSLERLPPPQQILLQELKKDPDVFGILRPVGPSGWGFKSVGQDTALLYLALQSAGQLPTEMTGTVRERRRQEIGRLVLDGVLCIEWNGNFVSGPEAASLIYDKKSITEGEGTLARLSVEALKYGQALRIKDPAQLSLRLYLYNRLPFSRFWKGCIPSSDALTEQLGIRGGAATEILDKHWVRLRSFADNGWLAWNSKYSHPAEDRNAWKKAGSKLYVSPKIEFIREAFHAALDAFTRSPTRRFKIANDAPGMLRPDKFVACFDSFEDLQTAADMVKSAVNGCPAHGVPFTAELCQDGLLSWGMDPPAERGLGSKGGESWRLWVINQLATALIAAGRVDMADLAPWQFALKRLQLAGVDIHSWAPAQQIWQGL
jgi:hypothetical protein